MYAKIAYVHTLTIYDLAGSFPLSKVKRDTLSVPGIYEIKIARYLKFTANFDGFAIEAL